MGFAKYTPQSSLDEEVYADEEHVAELVQVLEDLEYAKDAARKPNADIRKAEKRLRELLPPDEVQGKVVRIPDSPFLIDGGPVERSIPKSYEKEERFQYRPKRSVTETSSQSGGA